MRCNIFYKVIRAEYNNHSWVETNKNKQKQTQIFLQFYEN